MAFKNLPEHLKSDQPTFKGKKFDVYVKEMANSDGKKFTREIVVHPGAVVILPLLSAQKIVLIRNLRHSIQKTLYELPAGTLEEGEQPIDTARRELIEEAGYSCDSIEPLLSFYTSPGFCTEIMHCFVAKELHFVGQKLEVSEQIETVTMSLEEALAMIDTQEIVDGKTIATLLYFASKRQNSLRFID